MASHGGPDATNAPGTREHGLRVQAPRRRLLLSLTGLAVLSACDYGHLTDSVRPVPQTSTAPPDTPSPALPACPAPPPAQYYLHAGPRTIALTIDDGPDPRYTPAVLDILGDNRVEATFCVVGQSAARYPELVRRISGAGHTLANHTWSHPADITHMADDQIRDEIERASQAIEEATDQGRPTFFRAPGGGFTPAVLSLCAQLGLQPLAWSVDPHDWEHPGTQQIVDTVLHGTRTGSIILNHDGGGDRTQTVEALRIYLPRLLQAGFRFTTPTVEPRPQAPTDPCAIGRDRQYR